MSGLVVFLLLLTIIFNLSIVSTHIITVKCIMGPSRKTTITLYVYNISIHIKCNLS